MQERYLIPVLYILLSMQKKLGMIQEISSPQELLIRVAAVASDIGGKSQPAFASIKSLLRKSVADDMVDREQESIRTFIKIWYSEKTMENLKKITIH